MDRLPTKEFEGEVPGKYDAMGESEESLEERSNASPVIEEAPTGPLYQYGVSSSNLSIDERKRGEKLIIGSSWMSQIPIKLKESTSDHSERIERLFEPDWALTTKLVWVIWFAASAGYTVSLPCHPPALGRRSATLFGHKQLADAISFRSSMCFCRNGSRRKWVVCRVEVDVKRVWKIVSRSASNFDYLLNFPLHPQTSSIPCPESQDRFSAPILSRRRGAERERWQYRLSQPSSGFSFSSPFILSSEW